MPRALILGGTGAIGRAAARALLLAGWRVEVTGRDPSHFPTDLAGLGASFIPADPRQLDELRLAIGPGADLLVDALCFTAGDARLLMPLAELAGSTVMISSKAVYADSFGNHSNSQQAPYFDGPIKEDQATVPPGTGDWNSREGYGRNKVAAEQVLLESGLPITVIRPSKVHGAGARPPREWVFVRRVLDRRPLLVLGDRGAGTDHTTAAANLAQLILVVARDPGCRILNCADPDAPSALDIARTVASLMGHHWEEVLLDSASEGTVGIHPWSTSRPIVLDTSAAGALGYRPAGDFASTVGEEISWLVQLSAQAADLSAALDEDYFQRFFDYDGEDALLSSRHHPACG
jgi:nucleoside-diphosphate-sugar epimerase